MSPACPFIPFSPRRLPRHRAQDPNALQSSEPPLRATPCHPRLALSPVPATGWTHNLPTATPTPSDQHPWVRNLPQAPSPKRCAALWLGSALGGTHALLRLTFYRRSRARCNSSNAHVCMYHEIFSVAPG
ncbi:hypothetical protein OF83DRAFT_1122930, partial [Amylostereum chailletii]